jgi:cation diffusion facilitator CzcD-associated flavoprotein CzcO
MTLLERAAAPPRQLDAEIIIVGAGFGGLGMAIQLKKAGFTSFIVLERASEVGGTWRDNIYPGCACDIPSMLYSFSFEKHVGWSRLYPQQAELLNYLKRTSEKHGVRPHIRFNSDLAEARYDEASDTWQVRLKDGTTRVCRVVISAMGPLSKPNMPSIPGMERFAGRSFHSSGWDYSVDLAGKDVVVVGTGASAIQFVPQIAPEVARMAVFQRTPPWIIPRGDKLVGKVRKSARKRLPLYAWLVRKVIYWMLEFRAIGFVVNPRLLKLREKLVLRFIAESVPDPVLRAKVTPEYRAGCKRVLISDDYYPAIQRPNVELVTTPLAEIREHSVVDKDATQYPADVIIYATGFKATEGLVPVRFYGRGGVELGDAWREGMNAYLGTSIAGFPNLFLVIGPNTGLGHNSMVFMMEAHYRYILGALEYMRKNGVRALDVKPDVQTEFNAKLQQRMAGTVWSSGCSSWYIDARGKNTSLWPGFTFVFRNLTKEFDPDRYQSTETATYP